MGGGVSTGTERDPPIFEYGVCCSRQVVLRSIRVLGSSRAYSAIASKLADVLHLCQKSPRPAGVRTQPDCFVICFDTSRPPQYFTSQHHYQRGSHLKAQWLLHISFLSSSGTKTPTQSKEYNITPDNRTLTVLPSVSPPHISIERRPTSQ